MYLQVLHGYERAPFYCNSLIFTRADDQCFITHLIVNQAENYTQDIHWNLPSDWLVHNTPSGYMDRYGWMKAMSLFSRTCGDRKLNTHVLFFDGHYIHSDDKATHIIWSQHISPFILKDGDSTNYQTNDNEPNLKLKRYYGISKLKRKRQHGTLKFTPSHMNYVLLEIWYFFQQKSASVIIDAFKNQASDPCPT